MELRELNNQESRLQQAARVYAEVVTRGIVLLFYSVIGILAIMAAFLAVKLAWEVVEILLRTVR